MDGETCQVLTDDINTKLPINRATLEPNQDTIQSPNFSSTPSYPCLITETTTPDLPYNQYDVINPTEDTCLSHNSIVNIDAYNDPRMMCQSTNIAFHNRPQPSLYPSQQTTPFNPYGMLQNAFPRVQYTLGSSAGSPTTSYFDQTDYSVFDSSISELLKEQIICLQRQNNNNREFLSMSEGMDNASVYQRNTNPIHSTPMSHNDSTLLALTSPPSPLIFPKQDKTKTNLCPTRTEERSSRISKKICHSEGCKTFAVSRGLCVTHGGGRRCRLPDCANGAQSKGLCIRHGGGKRCDVWGCNKGAQSGGKCVKHGGGRRCTIDGCQSTVKNSGLCVKHGGGRRCSMQDCYRNAKAGGRCSLHGGAKQCQEEGCKKVAISRGVCVKHGGRRQCMYLGCLTSAVSKNLCVKHGGGRRCKTINCGHGAQTGGFCVKHGGGTRCNVEGCSKTVAAKGKCNAHSEKERCEFEGCKRLARKTDLGTAFYCLRHRPCEAQEKNKEKIKTKEDGIHLMAQEQCHGGYSHQKGNKASSITKTIEKNVSANKESNTLNTSLFGNEETLELSASQSSLFGGTVWNKGSSSSLDC